MHAACAAHLILQALLVKDAFVFGDVANVNHNY
jgi:hypothetical protein